MHAKYTFSYSLVHARSMCIQLFMFGVVGACCAKQIDSQRLPAYAPAFNPHLKIGKEGTASPATAQALNDRKPYTFNLHWDRLVPYPPSNGWYNIQW